MDQADTWLLLSCYRPLCYCSATTEHTVQHVHLVVTIVHVGERSLSCVLHSQVSRKFVSLYKGQLEVI